ncbi:class I SAM-dependent methyltransferase [Streptomyces canus]|uniref:class I SAM-dependent methyltransferase n=1 Tax=Streptomyces canus TaxID=58343 RepID=UPI00339DC813
MSGIGGLSVHPITAGTSAELRAGTSPSSAGEFIDRVHTTLGQLLGPGEGICLDVCCGTGAHAAPAAALGWTPVGVDLSRGQLRHAGHRLPVVVGDATALPLADASVPAAMCVLASTDVPDYAAVLREVARVLTVPKD